MIPDNHYPWRDGKSIDAAIDAGMSWLASKGMIAPGGGCDEAQIARVERQMGFALPTDLHWFYRRVRPKKSPDKEDGFSFFPLKELGKGKWITLEDVEPAADWANAQALMIGEDVTGSVLLWVRGHSRLPDGAIAGFHHDGGYWDDLAIGVVARSLGELISKVVCCNGLFPNEDNDWVEKIVPGLSLIDQQKREQDIRDLCVREFAELNNR
jgi:hypothetical protein